MIRIPKTTTIIDALDVREENYNNTPGTYIIGAPGATLGARIRGDSPAVILHAAKLTEDNRTNLAAIKGGPLRNTSMPVNYDLVRGNFSGIYYVDVSGGDYLVRASEQAAAFVREFRGLARNRLGEHLLVLDFIPGRQEAISGTDGLEDFLDMQRPDYMAKVLDGSIEPSPRRLRLVRVLPYRCETIVYSRRMSITTSGLFMKPELEGEGEPDGEAGEPMDKVVVREELVPKGTRYE